METSKKDMWIIVSSENKYWSLYGWVDNIDEAYPFDAKPNLLNDPMFTNCYTQKVITKQTFEIIIDNT